MENPALVSVAPERGTTMYLVHSKATLDEFCDVLWKEFQDGNEFRYFCKKISDLYLTLKTSWVSTPPGYIATQEL